jgi:hypothetical protein
MKIERRQFLHVAAGAAALSTVSWFAISYLVDQQKVKLLPVEE